jgi:16S rRNA (cytidine1402-2'-O)-methyltransferase
VEWRRYFSRRLWSLMSLQIIATPIGNPGDITLRAIESLRAAEIVIGEERAEVSKLLKRLEITGKRLELLNEHSKDKDVAELLELCRSQKVALVSDCGTPGFCDPGAKLVRACRAAGIQVEALPGASSLMALLSVNGSDMKEFLFRGFLPAEREERAQALNELKRERRAVVLMDTPYRLSRLLSELAQTFGERKALIGLDLTQPTEKIIEASLSQLAKDFADKKAEFILLLHPSTTVAREHSTPVSDRPVRRDEKRVQTRKFTPGRRDRR